MPVVGPGYMHCCLIIFIIIVSDFILQFYHCFGFHAYMYPVIEPAEFGGSDEKRPLSMVYEGGPEG